MADLLGYSVPETLTDDAGNSLKGVTVAVTGPSAYSGTAVSDATSGVLQLGPLPVGDYTVTLNGRSATVPVIASAADIVAAAAEAAPALAPVQSVNGDVGAVVLSAADVGADVSGSAAAAQTAAIAAAASDATAKASAAQSAAVAAAASAAAGAYTQLAQPDSIVINTSDANGNPTQITETWGATVRVTDLTYNTDGSPATQRYTINGVVGATKTFSYTSGVLTGVA